MDPQTPTFKEDLSTIIPQLPVPVQEFFASGKSETIARNLMQKYQLHIDQGTVVEREIIMLLLGLKNPEEFTKALVEKALLNQQTVTGIIQDVNTQIFVPLREEEMKSEGIKMEPPKPVVPPPQPQPPRTMTMPPQGVYAPPLQSPRYFHLENKLPITRLQSPAVSRPTPPKTAPPRSWGSQTSPTSRAMDSSRMLEDHEEPHINIGNTGTPLQQALRTVLPPPPNLPGALPPPVPQKVEPVASPAPKKPYLSDPYREPIE